MDAKSKALRKIASTKYQSSSPRAEDGKRRTAIKPSRTTSKSSLLNAYRAPSKQGKSLSKASSKSPSKASSKSPSKLPSRTTSSKSLGRHAERSLLAPDSHRDYQVSCMVSKS